MIRKSITKLLIILFLLLLTAFIIQLPGSTKEIKITPMPEVMQPRSILVKDNLLLVSEKEAVSLYSLETFDLLKRFAPKGEGPGEFRFPPNIYMLDDSFFADGSGKTACFSLKGQLLRETKKTSRGRFIPVKENFVFLKPGFDLKKRTVTFNVQVVDKSNKMIKELYTGEDEDVFLNFSGDTGREVKRMTPHCFKVTANRDKIFIADSQKGFFFEVFDYAGKHVTTIDKETGDVRVPDAYKQAAMDKLRKFHDWERMKNNRFVFYPHFPRIKEFRVDGLGLYVETYKQEGTANEFIVLDFNGKIIKKVFLPAEDVVYTFSNGVYYYLKEDPEEEQWELFKVKVL